MKQTYKPASLDDVRDIIKDALANETSLSITGSGSKSGLGYMSNPEADLQLQDMSGIVAYEPEELILVARTGTSLSEIETLLADNNQMLSFEPFHPQTVYGAECSGTIGGMVAAGLSGPRRIASGGIRDYLLGFTAVSGRGDFFQSGSRVMKNVTGYDLSKLMAGSFGSLAVMDEITLKVLPAPETSCSLVVACADIAGAQTVCSQAFGSAHEPTAAAILPPDIASLAGLGDTHIRALIRLEGVEVSVNDRVAKLQDMLKTHGKVDIIPTDTSISIWSQIRDAAFLPHEAEQTWKISIPPTACSDVLSHLKNYEISSFMDWAGGLIWLAGSGATLGDDIRAALAKTNGGHATLMRAPDHLRQTVPVFQPQAAALAALQSRIRNAFDPKSVLNPGRMGT